VGHEGHVGHVGHLGHVGLLIREGSSISDIECALYLLCGFVELNTDP
jgi:hypothetical protein